MKIKQLTQGLCTLLSLMMLSACGESLSAGVSLGGSGSGLDKPNNNGGPNLGSADEDSNEKVRNYHVGVPRVVADRCHGLDREIKFADKDAKTDFLGKEQVKSAETKLMITVYNNTAQPIFERLPSCSPLVVFHKVYEDKEYDTLITLDQSLTCPNDQSIQILKPFEKRVYEMNLDFVNQVGFFNVSYQNSIASSWSAQEDQWHKCELLSSEFEVKTIQDRPPTKDDQLSHQMIPNEEDNLLKPTLVLKD